MNPFVIKNTSLRSQLTTVPHYLCLYICSIVTFKKVDCWHRKRTYCQKPSIQSYLC